MENQSLTPSEIKSLLDYRVHLSVENVDISEFIIGDYDGYSGWVGELFGQLNWAKWLDYIYKPEHARRLVENPELIEQVNLGEIVTILTFIIRSERFSVGSFAEAIEDGTMLRLLNRLELVANFD